jgi:hypothetical protein
MRELVVKMIPIAVAVIVYGDPWPVRPENLKQRGRSSGEPPHSFFERC